MTLGGSVSLIPREPYLSLFNSDPKWVSKETLSLLSFFSTPHHKAGVRVGVGVRGMGSGTRHGEGAHGWTWDTQPPSLPPAKRNPFRTGFPSCAPKSEELKSFPARTMSTARDISTLLWQKFGQRANMQAMAYYNRTGEGKRPCNILTRDSVGTGKGSSKLENSPLISDSVCPYNVLSVMQANQEENC